MASTVRSPGLPTRERGAPVSAENAILLDGVRFALEHAVRNREWVVVVCPSKAMASQLQRMAMGALPKGSNHGGRTSQLPGEGRFSVAAATTTRFLPEDTPFTVMFLGWSEATDQQLEGMRYWKGQATKIAEGTASTARTG